MSVCRGNVVSEAKQAVGKVLSEGGEVSETSIADVDIVLTGPAARSVRPDAVVWRRKRSLRYVACAEPSPRYPIAKHD